MASTDDVRQLIIQQLGTLSGLVAMQEAADPVRRPAAYYVVGEAVSDEPVGYPVVTAGVAPATSLAQSREARIPISAHGTAARSSLSVYLTRMFAEADTLRQGMTAQGMRPVRAIGPRRSSPIYRTGHEPRWVADLIVRYTETIAGSNGVDDAVAIVVDLASTGGGDIDVPAAITVPED